MALTLTPVYTEHFVSDSNPLNPADWVVADGASSFRAIGGLGEVSTVSDGCGNNYGGSVLQPDQYISVTIGSWNVNSIQNLGIVVRSSPDQVSNAYGINCIPNDPTTTSVEFFKEIGGVVTDFEFDLTQPAINVGDVLTLAVVGSSVYYLLNGVLVFSAKDQSLTSGLAGIAGDMAGGLTTDGAFSKIVVGTAAGSFITPPYSVPDCRDYATFPNASRNVQNTLIYDVQTSCNGSVPTPDSRESLPVDSRNAPNVPENSRTSGTFGPGE